MLYAEFSAKHVFGIMSVALHARRLESEHLSMFSFDIQTNRQVIMHALDSPNDDPIDQ